MSREDLIGLIDTWAQRLGLERWNIKIVFEESLDGAMFEVAPDSWYDEATLRVSPNYESWEWREAQQAVIHELLHIHLRDLEQTWEAVHGCLGQPAQKQARLRWEAALEGIVDRLAWRIVEITS